MPAVGIKGPILSRRSSGTDLGRRDDHSLSEHAPREEMASNPGLAFPTNMMRKVVVVWYDH